MVESKQCNWSFLQAILFQEIGRRSYTDITKEMEPMLWKHYGSYMWVFTLLTIKISFYTGLEEVEKFGKPYRTVLYNSYGLGAPEISSDFSVAVSTIFTWSTEAFLSLFSFRIFSNFCLFSCFDCTVLPGEETLLVRALSGLFVLCCCFDPLPSCFDLPWLETETDAFSDAASPSSRISWWVLFSEAVFLEVLRAWPMVYECSHKPWKQE